jgi:hypothetical protein
MTQDSLLVVLKQDDLVSLPRAMPHCKIFVIHGMSMNDTFVVKHVMDDACNVERGINGNLNDLHKCDSYKLQIFPHQPDIALEAVCKEIGKMK